MGVQPQDYAIVIGLNDYPNFGNGGRSLAGAIEDANRVDAWLRDTKTGGGLPKKHCKLITSTPEPLEPTRTAIDNALQWIWSDAKSNGGGRRLYFYFSGHGQAKEADDVALCLCNWSPDFYRGAALSSEGYRKFILKCTPFSEVVVLLDCCRVRSVDAVASSSELECALAGGAAGASGFMVAYASEFQSAAYEAASAPGPLPADGEEGPMVRGHFTEALLAGLHGAAARAEGGVTAHALQNHLEKEVTRIAAEAGHSQNARVLTTFKMAADPVFGSAMPAANFRISFKPTRSGAIRLEDPDLNVVREDDVKTGPWDVRLQKGMHLIEELGTHEQMPIPFRPTAGVTSVEF
jgi:hypothetical protein